MFCTSHAKFLVTLILLAKCIAVSAKLVPFTLAEMTSHSDFIAMGTVKSIVEAGTSQSGASVRHRVIISIDQTLKGDLPREIELYAYPKFVEGATFKKDERVLIFLERSEAGYALVQGFLGKITLAKEIAGPIHLANQPEKLLVKELVLKIEGILKARSKPPK